MNTSPLSRNVRIKPDRHSWRFGPVISKSTAEAFSQWKREMERDGAIPAVEDLLETLVGNAWDIVMEKGGTVPGTHQGKPTDAERVVLALKRGTTLREGIRHRSGLFLVALPVWTYLVAKHPDGFRARPQGGGKWVSASDCDAFAARLVEFDRMIPELMGMIPGIQRDLEDYKLATDRKKLSRMIVQTTAQQLVREHLLPLGISASCYVDEEGTTVHVQLRKTYTGSLSIPVDGLANALKDTDYVQGALSLEKPDEEENPFTISGSFIL